LPAYVFDGDYWETAEDCDVLCAIQNSAVRALAFHDQALHELTSHEESLVFYSDYCACSGFRQDDV
jgi:hypothetical protein